MVNQEKSVHHVQGGTENLYHALDVGCQDEKEKLLNVKSGSHLQPYTTTIQVEGQQLTYWVSLSLVSNDTCKLLWSNSCETDNILRQVNASERNCISEYMPQ